MRSKTYPQIEVDGHKVAVHVWKTFDDGWVHAKAHGVTSCGHAIEARWDVPPPRVRSAGAPKRREARLLLARMLVSEARAGDELSARHIALKMVAEALEVVRQAEQTQEVAA